MIHMIPIECDHPNTVAMAFIAFEVTKIYQLQHIIMPKHLIYFLFIHFSIKLINRLKYLPCCIKRFKVDFDL